MLGHKLKTTEIGLCINTDAHIYMFSATHNKSNSDIKVATEITKNIPVISNGSACVDNYQCRVMHTRAHIRRRLYLTYTRYKITISDPIVSNARACVDHHRNRVVVQKITSVSFYQNFKWRYNPPS